MPSLPIWKRPPPPPPPPKKHYSSVDEFLADHPLPPPPPRQPMSGYHHCSLLRNCPACGEEHLDLQFRPLKGIPAFSTWSHWSTCPNSGDPIFKNLKKHEHPPDPQQQLQQLQSQDNHNLREAGCKLAEAAIHVAREYDGIHRLMLAVAGWATAVANEGGRPHKTKDPAENDTITMVDKQMNL